jgi:hypothetical protein
MRKLISKMLDEILELHKRFLSVHENIKVHALERKQYVAWPFLSCLWRFVIHFIL